MNTILLTVLLTLLGTGLIVLLVWLSVVAYKATKFKKCTLSRLVSMDESMTTSYNNLYNHTEEVGNSASKNLEDYKVQMRTEVNEVYNSINSNSNNTFNSINNNYIELNNKMLALFEELSNKIKLVETTEPSFIFKTEKSGRKKKKKK